MTCRSYEVEVLTDEGHWGFVLRCYESDECVWQHFFRNSDDAHHLGNRFLDGLYLSRTPHHASM